MYVSESSPVSIEHISSRDDSSPEFVDKISSESSPEMFVDEIPLHREFTFEGLENDWVHIIEPGSSTVSFASSNTVTIPTSFISVNNTVKADTMCPFNLLNSQNSNEEIRENLVSNIDENHARFRKDELIVKSANNVTGSPILEQTASAASKMNFVNLIPECDILNQSNYNLVNKNEQSPVHVHTKDECPDKTLKYEHEDGISVARTRSLKGEIEKKPGKPSGNERGKTVEFFNQQSTSNCTGEKHLEIKFVTK